MFFIFVFVFVFVFIFVFVFVFVFVLVFSFFLSFTMVPLGHHRPLACGQESDLENEDDKILNTTGLPEEIAGDVEAFNIRNDEI